MIRFACPGCGASFTVGDEKAGKSGKCPKCQSAFVIPAPERAPAPAPASGGASVEIAPCPGCQARLTVSVGDLGQNVQCPTCQTTFTAARPGAAPPAPPAPSPQAAFGGIEAEDDGDDRPSRRSGGGGRRSRKQASGFGAYLKFDRMITPIAVQVVFWIGVVVICIMAAFSGVMALMSAGKASAIATAIGVGGAFLSVPAGILILRLYCELLIVIFRISETLQDIKFRLEDRE